MKKLLRNTLAGILIAGASFLPSKAEAVEPPIGITWKTAYIGNDSSQDYPGQNFDLLFYNFDDFKNDIDISNNTNSLGADVSFGAGSFASSASYDIIRYPIKVKGISKDDSSFESKLFTYAFADFNKIDLKGKDAYGGYPHLGGSSVNFSSRTNSLGNVRDCKSSHTIAIDAGNDVEISGNKLYPQPEGAGAIVVSSFAKKSGEVKATISGNEFISLGEGSGNVAISAQRSVDAGTIDGFTKGNVYIDCDAVKVPTGVSDEKITLDKSAFGRSSGGKSGEITWATTEAEALTGFVEDNGTNNTITAKDPIGYNFLSGETQPAQPLPGMPVAETGGLIALLGGLGVIGSLFSRKKR